MDKNIKGTPTNNFLKSNSIVYLLSYIYIYIFKFLIKAYVVSVVITTISI